MDSEDKVAMLEALPDSAALAAAHAGVAALPALHFVPAAARQA